MYVWTIWCISTLRKWKNNHKKKNYLSNEIGISTIYAFVMPQNTYSGRALLKNNFKKEDYLAQEKNWGGQEVVDVEVYTYINKK